MVSTPIQYLYSSVSALNMVLKESVDVWKINILMSFKYLLYEEQPNGR